MHSQRLVFFMVALSIFGANFSPGAATLAAAATSAGQLALSSATYSVAQNAGAVTITVVRTGGSAGAAAVSYTTTNSTATAGTNFTTEQGQLTWASGDASPKTVRIPISNAKPFAGAKALGFYIAHVQGALLGSPDFDRHNYPGERDDQQTHRVAERKSDQRTSGSGSTLSWSSTNATSCTASGAWSGSQATSGTESTGALSSTSTYTLTCTGTGGSVSQSATVTVAASAPTPSPPTAASCTGTSGPLTLKASAVRASGISPLLMFFDATGTKDSSITGNTTAFQDVAYTWNFGDANASGTGTWKYGSNAGRNSKNSATGGVAAHLYVTPGANTAYTVTVTAHDGTNTASCKLGVTAYDPAGSNGFAGTKTACVSSSGTPVAGSGGCPAGATVLKQSNVGSALSAQFGSNKRVLFKCGDTFTGGYTVAAGASTWSIGAYGGCENTQSGRPIFRNTGGNTLSLNSSNTAVGPIDGRISDIDFEGGGSGLVAVSTTSGFNVKQITLYNLYANGLHSAYYLSGGSQTGIVQSVMTGMIDRIGVFWNYAENNCLNGSSAFNCGQGSSPVFADIRYAAVLGNDFNGQGVSSAGGFIETFRMSACRLCVITNNTFQNASAGAATFKFHSGNTYDSRATWIGQYTELVEISDNVFGGTSGAQLTEVSPQNGNYDERLRNIVLERNIFAGISGAKGVLLSAVNATLRDNVFYSSSSNSGSRYGAQIAQRAQ